jgi:hypothetical protein
MKQEKISPAISLGISSEEDEKNNLLLSKSKFKIESMSESFLFNLDEINNKGNPQKKKIFFKNSFYFYFSYYHFSICNWFINLLYLFL